MVAFGPAPSVPAHAQQGNPMAPRRDRSIEAGPRGRAPPVPRAPRAAPKAQSAGALARDMWSRRPGSGPASRSESRRPREESPFSTICEHRRVSSLTREVNAPENQRFEMGPQRSGRPASADRRDYKRGHVLGQENTANGTGMPWSSSNTEELAAQQQGEPAVRNAARRHTLRHERQAADQKLEWAPVPAMHPGGEGSHGIVNAFKREEKEAIGEFLPGAARNAPPGFADQHGRRNVLNRETSTHQSLDAPQPSGFDGEVPSYGRKGKLVRENPVGFASGNAGGEKKVTTH